MLLFPQDVVRSRRVDAHFADEAAAARAAGLRVALVDHDALAAGDAASVPGDAADAVYRGWMLTSAAYAGLAGRAGLRTSAEQYRRAHELPGWYEGLAPFTPESAWTVGDGRAGFDEARAALRGSGPAVLRDYTKSMKHYWHEAAYIPDLADAGKAWAVARRFRELRGDDFAGGFVLRRFEEFAGPEARTWWVGGECRLVTAHPDSPGEQPYGVEVSFLREAVAALGLPFVTLDIVRRADGQWRVVELGDGQVSDRPSSTPAEDFLAAIR
ncbi:ATP-grasp domain-containing protein [Actinoplanes sp. NPDC049596]|uniref:ATP-grasp domain-containing protein n=1 Tax=unclassified Actinoplanes TaxID=2626549 RepID=UPI00342E7CDE